MEARKNITAFDRRSSRAVQFEADVETYLRQHPNFAAIARNGTEHTHPDFVSQLRNLQDPGSKFVRFAPDGVVLLRSDAKKSCIHWEAKDSINIERDAYLTYSAYNLMGARVLVFIRPRVSRYHAFNGRDVYWNYVEAIHFIPSEIVTARVRKESRFPIDDDGWICPRQGHGNVGNGSGTPYKEIDITCMKKIPDFYMRLLSQ